MRLTIRQTQNGNSKELSKVTFSNNAISEIVTFWANTKHRSPQFPLDLTPNINQMTDVYPDWLIPVMNANSTIQFTISNDSPDSTEPAVILNKLRIVQLKLNFMGPPDEIPHEESDWQTYFNINSEEFKVVYTPSASAYVSPVNTVGPVGTITMGVKEHLGSEIGHIANFSYQVLVCFEIEGTAYYVIIDPLIKVTNQSGGG